MEQHDKTARDELADWIRSSVRSFRDFLKPDRDDHILVKLLKALLKIPVALFVVLVSPVLLMILGIIFIILL